MIRGRVLEVASGIATIRGERAVAHAPAGADWQPGDLVVVDGDRAERVRAYVGPPYPGPHTEVARLPPARLAALQARAKALAVVREVFAARDFLEVETPLLVPSPGLEIHLDALAVTGGGYLITSPEYQMKRLLAGGFERIYQVCKCFRGNEHGPHHAGEFTMIEWYRAFADLDAIVDDTEQLVYAVVRAISGSHYAAIGGRRIDVTPPWPRITVRAALAQHAGLTIGGDETAAQLAQLVRGAGIECAIDAAWDDAFFAVWLARVEPALAALELPILVEDWPAPLAALARRRPDDPRVAFRFEAYVGGLELANAFGELTDPVEQRARFTEELAIRAARGRATPPIDEQLLAALAEGLPPSAGIALGFDRLVMLATGAASIDQVLTFTAAEL